MKLVIYETSLGDGRVMETYHFNPPPTKGRRLSDICWNGVTPKEKALPMAALRKFKQWGWDDTMISNQWWGLDWDFIIATDQVDQVLGWLESSLEKLEE